MMPFTRVAIAFARLLIASALPGAMLLATPSALADETADRQELLGMLASIESAINARDMSAVMPYIAPSSVVTFQNGEVLTGPQEIQGFFERMLVGGDSILTDVHSQATVSAPATFLTPDIAIAHGTLIDTFKFRGGSELTLDTVWTTTVVRADAGESEGGDDIWHIGSLHMSTDVFDNPVLHAVERSVLYAAIAGLLVGLAIAALIAVLRRHRRARVTP